MRSAASSGARSITSTPRVTLGPILPLLHDRMTEAVLGSMDEAGELFHHFPPKPLTTIDVTGEGPRGD